MDKNSAMLHRYSTPRSTQVFNDMHTRSTAS
jgi:hypothetical protein